MIVNRHFYKFSHTRSIGLCIDICGLDKLSNSMCLFVALDFVVDHMLAWHLTINIPVGQQTGKLLDWTDPL